MKELRICLKRLEEKSLNHHKPSPPNVPSTSSVANSKSTNVPQNVKVDASNLRTAHKIKAFNIRLRRIDDHYTTPKITASSLKSESEDSESDEDPDDSVAPTAATASTKTVSDDIPEDGKYPCGKCVKKFCTKHDLREHSQTHIGKIIDDDGSSPTDSATDSDSDTNSDSDESVKVKSSNSNEVPRERKYPCGKCNKKFYIKDDLRKHTEIHKRRNLIVGDHTSSSDSSSASDSDTDTDSNESANSKFSAAEDALTERKSYSQTREKKISTKDVLRKHTETHKRRRKLVAKEETSSSDSSDSSDIDTDKVFNESVKSKSSTTANDAPRERKYPCRRCEKKFFTRGDLNEHTQIHTRKNYIHKCKICKKAFPKRSRLIKHERIHDDNRPRQFKCEHEHCGKSFKEEYILKAHLLLYREKEFKCPICPKMFVNKSGVTTHMLSHTQEKPHNCSKCDKGFSNQSNKLVHERLAHKIPCPDCDLYFVTANELNVHKVDHGIGFCKFCQAAYPADEIEEHLLSHKGKGQKPFKCPTCDRTFSTKNILKQHKFQHTDRFACPICKKRFTENSRLNRHKLIHTGGGEKNFACNICDQRLSSAASLIVHGKKWHTEPPMFKCTGCNKTFKLQVEADDHISRTKSENNEKHVIQIKYIPAKPFKCGFCDVGFSAKGDLEYHIRTHTSYKDHVCTFCEKPFLSFKGLKAHLRIHTGEKPHQCDAPNCGLSFGTAATLRAHKETHSKDRKLVHCTICDKTYLHRNGLRMHMRTHEGTIERSYKCGHEGCKKSYTASTTLKAHVQRVHNAERPNACGFCDRAFFSKSHLERHVAGHTGETGDGTHKCVPCRKIFSNNRELNIHLKTVHNRCEKKHFCSFCNKAFVRRSELMKHMRMHTGEKSEKCNFCEKTFNCKNNLRTHIKTHTLENGFDCQLCEMSFKTKSAMEYHIRSHLQERIHVCTYCSKGFVSIGRLLDHIRFHTKEKRHKCEDCGKAFIAKVDLKRHVRSMHEA